MDKCLLNFDNLINSWTSSGRRIKGPLVIVVASILALLIAILFIAGSIFQNSRLNQDLERDIKSVMRAIDLSVTKDTEALNQLSLAILNRPDLEQLLISRDRQGLLKRTHGLFEKLNSRHGVSHFYFHLPSRENLLRVHQPNRFGDKIIRPSILESSLTKRGAKGIEMGPLGSYTLRVVHPWWVGERLIGYIELGKETGSILTDIKANNDVDLIWFAKKLFIDRNVWKKNHILANSLTSWDTMFDMVVVSTTSETLLPKVVELLSSEASTNTASPTLFTQKGREYVLAVRPTVDSNDEQVGQIAIIRDVTVSKVAFRKVGLLVLVAVVLLFMASIFLIGRFARRVEDEVAKSRDHLETAVRERTTELLEAKEIAETANRTKSNFLSSMNHELRTPLNAIMGFSEMIRGQLFGPVGAPVYVEYAQDINRSGQHLLQLINDLLDVGKIEAGEYELQFEMFDIGNDVTEVATLVDQIAQSKNVVLNVEIPDHALELNADRRAVHQILINLISNAIKYSDPGGSVRVSLERITAGACITIEDRGIGIRPEDLEKIRSPWVRVSNPHSSSREGAGLGLSIVNSLLDLHGGTLTIESEIGIGTTVKVIFPA